MFGSLLQKSSMKKSHCLIIAAMAFLSVAAAQAQGIPPDAIKSVLMAESQPGDRAPPKAPEPSALSQPSAAAQPSATVSPNAAVPAEPPQQTAVETLKLAAPKPSPEELYLSKDPQPTFTAETAALTEEAAQKYLAIVEAGGWPVVPSGMKLVVGASGPAVATLKQRLIVEGDLNPAAQPGDTFDAAVEAAVKHYQERQGLEQTGAVGGQTLRALNVTAIMRYNQLLASAKRLRTTKFGFGQRYVVVNIPSANVEAIEAGKVVRRYIAVVGKPDHPSPMVEAKITSINLNPTWTVPASIVKNEMIPHMQANPGYLAKEHIRIFDQTGTEVNPAAIDWANNSAAAFTLRQDSGAGNSLGTLRIDMPNKDAVYMHDTPSKSLFSASVRFASHGCVRVSKVQDLAAWLLENNISADPASNPSAPGQSGWTPEMLSAAITRGMRFDVKLTKTVPVAWVYLTGYATPDHAVHFRSDVYDLDSGAEAVSAAVPHAQPAAVAPAKPATAPAPQAQAPAVKTVSEREAHPAPQAE
jgi:murein L,D-transpeptidase YcbB/YkuD